MIMEGSCGFCRSEKESAKLQVTAAGSAAACARYSCSVRAMVVMAERSLACTRALIGIESVIAFHTHQQSPKNAHGGPHPLRAHFRTSAQALPVPGES